VSPPFIKARPTQKDIAKLAQVSQATVSLVLNGVADSSVPAITRRKVFRAAKNLGYVPNRVAQSLRTQRTKTIACIVPDITNPFYPALERGAQNSAEAHGYEILPGNVFIDDGISGTRLDRPALDRLRDLAAEGAFEVILVTAPDRLARRYAYQVVLVEEFIRDGCEVVFAHQSLGASPEEQMLLQMQGVFAEYERALIQERTRRGRVFAARQGRVNWGNPPYGYTYIRKTPTTPQHLVINETEAEIVRQIYRWCVEEQLSSYAIHQRLTAHGISPRKSSPRGWAQSSVIEIL